MDVTMNEAKLSQSISELHEAVGCHGRMPEAQVSGTNLN